MRDITTSNSIPPLIRLNTILIRNATLSQEALGATFGLAQTVACVARAGSPALVR